MNNVRSWQSTVASYTGDCLQAALCGFCSNLRLVLGGGVKPSQVVACGALQHKWHVQHEEQCVGQQLLFSVHVLHVDDCE